MQFLEWCGQHPILTVVALLIVSDMVIGLARIVSE